MNSGSKPLVADLTGRELLVTRDFTAEELSSRRMRIASEIGDGAHLFIAGAPPQPRELKVQDANFYYFTGLETSHSYVIIDGGTGRTRIFMPSRDAMSGEEKHRLGFEDADFIKERLGVDEVHPSAMLTQALGEVKQLFFPHADTEGAAAGHEGVLACAKKRAEEEWDQAEPRYKRIVRMLQERFPGIGIEDACPLIYRMRTVKSAEELVVLQEAADLSAAVMIEAMKVTTPGMCESRLQAVAEYVFRDRGHCGIGYGVIAASGTNTWDGHYGLNNSTIKEDDIILLDCGPDLRHYTSDIARLWPANGTYSPWHRRVYGFITEYHKALIGAVRPGRLFSDIYSEADEKMAALCMGEGAPYADMKHIFDNMIQKGIGYMNHGVGMGVHDAMDSNWKSDPIPEGLVCVVDPMVWCEERHEYIRVEDTIVVTADGCRRLTGAAPFEIDDIEALMKKA